MMTRGGGCQRRCEAGCHVSHRGAPIVRASARVSHNLALLFAGRTIGQFGGFATMVVFPLRAG